MSQYPQQSVKEEKTLQTEDTKILHQLQFLLARVLGLNVSGITVSVLGEISSPLHQVLICGIAVLPQLCQFWDTIWSERADKDPYTASIRGMRMRLPELQDDGKKAKKLMSEGLPEGWENIEHVLHDEGLPYIPKVIRSELRGRHHNDLLAGHFGIEKTQKLIARKYYWPTLRQDIKAYVKSCDICLALKTVCHKPYGDLQLLPISTHQWKDLSIDFVTDLLILAD